MEKKTYWSAIGIIVTAVVLVGLAWWWQYWRTITLEVWRPHEECRSDIFSVQIDDETVAHETDHWLGTPAGMNTEYVKLTAGKAGETTLRLSLPACGTTPAFAWVYQVNVHPLMGIMATLITDGEDGETSGVITSDYWDVDIAAHEYVPVITGVYREKTFADHDEETTASLELYKTLIADFVASVFPGQEFVVTAGGFSYLGADNRERMYFDLRQYKDGAINNRSDLTIVLDLTAQRIILEETTDENIYYGTLPPVAIDPEEAVDLALARVPGHEKELFGEDEKVIRGEYQLQFDNEGQVYYQVRLNESVVLIDALSGGVLDEWWFNGVID